jgi:hypothetical protein
MVKFYKYMYVLLAAIIIGSLSQSANATIVFTAAGESTKGVEISFKAKLNIFEDTLTLVLTNDSPVDSTSPEDLLTSFYFDIMDENGIRPTLSYSSAIGSLYKTDKKKVLLEEDANLKASKKDGGWEFKEYNVASDPFMNFGIGTDGNKKKGPKNAKANYAIYTGDISIRSLANLGAMVKDHATFTFTGFTGFTNADIKSSAAFGYGTATDSFLLSDSFVNPEPASICLLAVGGFMLRRKRKA